MFLPDPSVFRKVVDRDAETLRGMLRSLGSRCSSPYYVESVPNAWGSLVNSLVFPLTYGLAHNRTMVTATLGSYGSDACSTFSCFFRPLASCPFRRRTLGCPKRRLFDCGDCSQSCEMPAMRPALLKKGDFSYALHGVDALPVFKQRGHFWLVAHLLAWLLRPNDMTRRRVKERARGLKRPLLTMHVRRGDSCRSTQQEKKARRCSDFAEYWYHAGAMRERYGLRSLFVATDDHAIALEFRNASSVEFPIVVSVAPGSEKLWDNILTQGNHTTTALDIITDIAVLARGDAFVGKFTSNVDRIAYALLAARSNCLKPVVSLDAPWCHDWSNAVGQSPYGSFLC